MTDPTISDGYKFCKLFEPSLTSNGVCQTYNSRAHSELYKMSPDSYANLFQSVYSPKGKYDVTIKYPDGIGSGSGLQLVLDQKDRHNLFFNQH